MKGFILKNHEAQALAAGKPVVIWRVCKTPITSIEELGDEEYDGPKQFFVEGGKLRTPTRWGSHEVAAPFPVGVPLFGKETWMPRALGLAISRIMRPNYRADDDKPCWRRLWRPSTSMPEWASRITLTLSDVKVRRPCDVTEEEAKAIVEFHDGPMNFCYRNSANSKVAYKTARDAFQRGFEVQYGERLALYHFTALATPQPKDS